MFWAFLETRISCDACGVRLDNNKLKIELCQVQQKKYLKYKYRHNYNG